MKTYVSAGLAALVLAGCSAGPETPPVEATTGPALEQAWVFDGFKAPEGAALAPDGAYLISNISGDGMAKDGDGSISRIWPDEGRVEHDWATGLDAPKGMVVKGDVLYVADIDQIVLLNATTGERFGEMPIPDSGFLNDMTVWNDDVYVSDSSNARIYAVGGKSPVIWLESPELEGVNGLLGDGDRMLITTMTAGDLLSVDVEGILTEIATGMVDADGIGLAPGGGYIVSSWPGEIFLAEDDGTVTQLLDTREDGILQNDLSVFGEMIVSPNWEPGTVTAWTLTR